MAQIVFIGRHKITWVVLVRVTEMFGRYLANHNILFMTDNSGVIEIVNKISSVLACLKYNILIRYQHVPGFQNTIADHLSRFQIDEAKQAANWLDANLV